MASTPTCDGRRSSLYRPKIEELVRDLNARLGLTMVFVSHDLSQVERVADRTARYLIPLGGMAIGNSMNAASLTLTRIRDDVREQRPKAEAALALGATGRQVASPILKTALQSALILGRSPSLGHWHRRVEERRDYRKQQIGAVHN